MNLRIDYLSGLVLILAIASGTRGDDQTRPWTPLDLDHIRGIYESKSISDEAIISALLMELDARLTLYKIPAISTERKNSDLGLLVNLISTPHSGGIEKRLESLNNTIRAIQEKKLHLENSEDVRKFVRIAVALDGAKVSIEDLVDLLDDPAMPAALTPQVLSAIEKNGTPISLIPRLVSLLQEPTNYLADTEGIGLPVPKRIYPIRHAACGSLRSLGIRCDETMKPPEGGISEQQFKLDEQSLTDQFVAWIKGADEHKALDAIRSASQIKVAQVHNLLQKLADDSSLSQDRRAEIRKDLTIK